MSRKTLHLLQEIATLYDQTERFLTIRIEMRTSEGERLLSGGGIWDKRLNRWKTPRELTVLVGDEIAAAPQSAIGVAHVLTVESSQVEYVKAFGEWLKAYQRDRPRPAFVDVLAGKRRGGKTWVMVALILLAAVAVPYRLHKDGHRVNFIGWLVVPSYPEQRELHEDIMAVLARRRDIASREMLQVLGAIPERWWTFRPHPTNGYMFIHGSQVYLKSANRPDSLKQGRVDVVGLNEGQKVDSEAPVHCAGNTIDGGGLLIMAANAPRRARGQWLKEVKYAFDDGRMVNPKTKQQVVRWFWVNPDKNTRIHQDSRDNFRIFAGVVNPKLMRADAESEWNDSQDVTFFAWKPSHVIKEVPADWINVTGDVIAAMRLRDCIRHHSTYTSFGGTDFNKWPWFAFVGFKAYRDPKRNNLLCYVAEREFRNEQDRDRPMTEREVIIELYKSGWRPEEIVLIADASGQWQNSESRQRGGVSAGHSSYDLFRSATHAQNEEGDLVIPSWEMHAPTTWKLKESKHFADPRRRENIDECNELFRRDRLFMLDTCTHLMTACKKAPFNPYAQGTPQELKDLVHIIDAFRYPIHRAQSALEPKRRDRGLGGPSTTGTTSPTRSIKPIGGRAFGSKR